MPLLNTDNPLALRLLITEDIYCIKEAAAADPEVKPEPAYFSYLGENNKYFLILVNDAGHEFTSSVNKESLVKTLKGKQMEMKDVALLNLHRHQHADFISLKAFFACSRIVLFGINPSSLGLPDIAGNQITLHEGVKILATYSFEEMYNDETKKRVFWSEMKKL